MGRVRFGWAAIAAVTLVGGIAVAEAQTSAIKQIEQRKEMMKASGAAMKTLTPMARGEAPWDQKAASDAARALAGAAPKIPAAFPAGTGPEAGKTDALPAIWQNKADFDAKAKAMQAETEKLLQVVQANDEAGFKAQFPKVGRTCAGCHESYRMKK
jgi:cytochrome c556